MEDLITRQDVESILNVVKSGAEQLPVIAQQLLTYRLYENVGVLVLGLVLFLIAIKCGRTAWELLKQKYLTSKEGDVFLFSTVLTLLAGIPSIVLLSVGFFSLLKIIFAPQVYLIEYFTKLL